jgi:ribonuclease P protein component
VATIYTIKPLKGYNAFSKAFENGITKSSKKATITIVYGESEILHLGVGIAKKRCKKAVIRNRIKRLLRETFRKLNTEEILPDKIAIITVFWKVAPSHPMLINLDEVYSEVSKLLSKF